MTSSQLIDSSTGGIHPSAGVVRFTSLKDKAGQETCRTCEETWPVLTAPLELSRRAGAARASRYRVTLLAIKDRTSQIHRSLLM
jgi:hypothetical protein